MTLIRAAAPTDMDAIRAIAASFDLLDSWPGAPDYLDLERDAGRLVVADGEGAVAGFAGTLTRGRLTHLGDLFIDPATQSAGLGGRLLDAVLSSPHSASGADSRSGADSGSGQGAGAGAAVVTFASSDPRALALYLRHGLRPRLPVWYLRGNATSLPEPAVDIRPATAGEIASLDAEIGGGRRAGQLAWYLGLPGAAAWATPDGYAVTRLVGDRCVLGPAGGHDPAASVRAAIAAARLAADERRPVHVAVFATHPLAVALVGAGFHIVDHDTFMATPAADLDTDRYIPHPDLG